MFSIPCKLYIGCVIQVSTCFIKQLVLGSFLVYCSVLAIGKMAYNIHRSATTLKPPVFFWFNILFSRFVIKQLF
uniref:Uncharacterized protein n=1 Tax=Anguilla anguilla TaxID=7936 RepID=A0A0E9P5H1_ANGAN